MKRLLLPIAAAIALGLCAGALLSAAAHAAPHRGSVDPSSVSIIGHPAGCPARLFCGCGLREHWNIPDKRLNKVSMWPKIYPRASGPAVGRAAVRIGGYHDHVMGIVGGGPGAWEVVDYNSGNHQSRRYVTADFPGYFFVAVRG